MPQLPFGVALSAGQKFKRLTLMWACSAWWPEVAGGPAHSTCGAKLATTAQGCRFGWDALATSERGGAERHGLGHPTRRRAAIAVTRSSERGDGGAIPHHTAEGGMCRNIRVNGITRSSLRHWDVAGELIQHCRTCVRMLSLEVKPGTIRNPFDSFTETLVIHFVWPCT